MLWDYLKIPGQPEKTITCLLLYISDVGLIGFIILQRQQWEYNEYREISNI